MGGDVSAASRVLHEALDNGINFLDTAACYGDTEGLIGEVVSRRRDEYVLATKAGTQWATRRVKAGRRRR